MARGNYDSWVSFPVKYSWSNATFCQTITDFYWISALASFVKQIWLDCIQWIWYIDSAYTGASLKSIDAVWVQIHVNTGIYIQQPAQTEQHMKMKMLLLLLMLIPTGCWSSATSSTGSGGQAACVAVVGFQQTSHDATTITAELPSPQSFLGTAHSVVVPLPPDPCDWQQATTHARLANNQENLFVL